LDISQGGKPSKLGLSASNIFASGTDSQWAYALTLARADHYLKSPKHSREIMPDFKNDWALLQAARINSSIFAAANNTLPSGSTRATPVSFGQLQ
jgi:alkylhydroperoxidase family enzyme